MAGGWPRLTKTPEGHLRAAASGMSQEEQLAYEAAVAKASSWLTAANQPGSQPLATQGTHANMQPTHHTDDAAHEYSMRLQQLQAPMAAASAAAAAARHSQMSNPGQDVRRKPSWGKDPGASEQGSPTGNRGPVAQLQWAPSSTKSPQLGPKGYALHQSCPIQISVLNTQASFSISQNHL